MLFGFVFFNSCRASSSEKAAFEASGLVWGKRWIWFWVPKWLHACVRARTPGRMERCGWRCSRVGIGCGYGCVCVCVSRLACVCVCVCVCSRVLGGSVCMLQVHCRNLPLFRSVRHFASKIPPSAPAFRAAKCKAALPRAFLPCRSLQRKPRVKQKDLQAPVCRLATDCWSLNPTCSSQQIHVFLPQV